MEREGPLLESLIHRLTETPEDFLAEPHIGTTGRVDVPAVVHDLIQILGGTVSASELIVFAGKDSRRDRNRLAVTLLLSWLLADEWFRRAKPSSHEILHLLNEEAAQIASQVPSKKFVTDPDRREEMVRVTLARLGYRPAGETLSQAQDRLTSLSSVERTRVLKASRAAEERARAIREALVKKAAEESADKWTRE